MARLDWGHVSEPLGKGGRSHLATPSTNHPKQLHTSLKEQQALWRAEWEAREARDPDAQAELDRLWAAAHLPSDLL